MLTPELKGKRFLSGAAAEIVFEVSWVGSLASALRSVELKIAVVE